MCIFVYFFSFLFFSSQFQFPCYCYCCDFIFLIQSRIPFELAESVLNFHDFISLIPFLLNIFDYFVCVVPFVCYELHNQFNLISVRHFAATLSDKLIVDAFCSSIQKKETHQRHFLVVKCVSFFPLLLYLHRNCNMKEKNTDISS